MEIEKFKDSLMHLRVIIEEIEKINIIERLETEKIKETTKKELKKLEIKKMDELEKLERSLNFIAKDQIVFIKEELRLRKITRKKINDIVRLETEIKEIERLKIEAIELKSSKLLSDLNMEKGIEIEEIREIEIKLEKLKIPKTIATTIKKLIITEKYLHKRY